MNKNLYRIVFNKARGMLMVVAEISRSCRAVACPASGPSCVKRQCITRLSAISFGLLLALGAVQPAAANIVADHSAPGKQQPTILNTANGTPQVNIQTPSKAGVSRNVYSQFDVNSKGAILNNSRKNVATQQGGMVAANPWLARGEARVILNEVNSRDPSRLNGYVEVAGKKAQVVIANPSGITCDGCGFINANRATLTTGQAQLKDGNLTGYAVSKGEIVVQGKGMDSSRQDYTDIIARSVKVNAGLWANDLKVTTGANTVDAAHDRVEAKAADAATRPQLAVDVANLGGMYAGKIRLTGTEAGVGVRNAGNIGAQAGTVVVTADGRIENSGTINSSGDTQLAGNGVTNSGHVFAGGNATVSSRGDVEHSGTLAATGNTTVSGTRITATKTSTLASGVGKDGKVGKQGDLRLTSNGTLTMQGETLAAGTLATRSQGIDARGGRASATTATLDAGDGDIDLRQAQVSALETLDARSAGKLNNDGGALNAKRVALNAHDISNQQGEIVQTGDADMTLATPGTLNNSGGRIATNATNLTLKGADINNRKGEIVHAGKGALGVTTPRFNGDEGAVASAGSLTANVGDLQLNQASTTAQRVTLDADNLSHRGGELVQKGTGEMHIASRGTLDNEGGTVAANGAINLKAGTLSNRSGNVTAAGDGSLDARVTDALDNEGGTLAANGDVTLQAGTLNNHGGKAAALGDGSLRAEVTGAVDNTAGLLTGNNAVALQAGSLDNRSGQTVAAGEGGLIANVGGMLNNEGGTFAADGDMNLTAGTLNNRSGKTIAAGDGNLTARIGGAVDNTQGTLVAGKDLDVQAGTLSNSGGVFGSNQNAVLRTRELDNAAGSVQAGQALTLNGSDAALTVNNRAGNLVAGKQLDVTASALSGDGKILSDGDMNLNLAQGFTNQSQTVANGALSLVSGGHVDNQGKLLAGKRLTLNAASASNAAGAELGGGETHLTLNGTLTNRGLIDGSLTHIQAATLDNLGTGRLYGDRIALQTGTLNNAAENGVAGTIAARDRLDIGAGTLNNSGHGLIYSAGAMAIGGGLDAAFNATGRGGVLTNRGATIESGGDMRIDMNEIQNLNNNLVTEVVVSEVSSHHEAVLKGKTERFDWSQVDTRKKNKYGVHTAKMPDGTSGSEFYEYNYTRTVQETRVKETDPGKIISGGNLTINSGLVHNQDSQIIAARLLSGVISVLNNDAATGIKTITDVGRQTRWYAKKKKKKLGGTKTSQGKSGSDYKPSPVTQTISLSTVAWQSNGAVQGSGAAPSGRDTGQFAQPVSLTFNGSQPVHLAPGQSWEVGQNVQDANGATPDRLVRTSGVNTRLPSASLYTVHASPTSGYLIETDARFTNERTWLSSDYMQKALSPNGDVILKRLGDGFYEQQLIRDQVANLTGKRYLSGFDDDNAQYKALMDAGIAFAKAHNLTAGVALSPEQMALLTSDMLWMVAETVQLADGSSQQVLVPQVYVRVKEGDVDGSGSLIAGNRVALQTGELNNSGTLLGRDITALSGNNITNSGTIRGSNIDIAALTDFSNIGGTLLADDSLQVKAGRDLTSTSTLRGDAANRHLDRTAGIYVQNDGGKLVLQGVNDVNLAATLVGNNGNGSTTTIAAGNNINLGTITTTHSERGDWGKDNYRDLTARNDIGSQIAGKGSVTLSAGNDLNARAATVDAGDALTAVAGRDLNVTAGESAYHLTEHSKQTSKGFLSGQSLETHDEVRATEAVASNFTGDKVTLLAGNDLAVRGSNVAGDGDVRLGAGNNLTIDTVEENRQENHQRKESKSGLMGTGGIGFTVGSQSLNTTDDGKSVTHAISTVGSSQGNLTLQAGNDLNARSAELIAGQDMTLEAKNIAITAAADYNEQTHKVEQKQSGFTLALSGTVGSAVNTAVETAHQAQSSGNGRIAALQNTKAALTGIQAAQAARLAQAQAGTPAASDNTVGVSLSYGSQSSSSTQHSEQTTARGGSLTAGDNVNITATGSGAKGVDGDILMQGATVQAGKDVNLTANRDINLLSAQNTQQQTGSNKSSGGSVGVGIGAGSGGWGINVSASVNKGKGSEKGNGTTHTETLVNAGDTVNLTSGRDTTLTGAQVSGETVKADVGRNLTLTSEQDSDRYDSKQQNASAGGSFTFGSMSGSANVNLSRDKMHSNYDSVVEQTGIYAGKGGFDVTVGEHTQLNGAVIGSTASADKNRLDTGTLGFSDIHNQADYKVEHQSIGLSTGGSIGSQFAGNLANTMLAGVNDEGHDSGTTRAAVSDGTLVIRDQDKQAQDVAQLSRDVEHANGSISQIFDKEKEQQRIQQAQLVGEMVSQATDIVRSEMAIHATEAAKAKLATASKDDLDKARQDILDKNPKANPDAEAIAAQAYQNYYDAEVKASGFGVGGTYSRVMDTAGAVIKGLAGSDLGAALAGGAAPWIAEYIGHGNLRLSDKEKIAAHAVVNAALAAAQGQNAAAGAAGAVTGELMGMIAADMYGKKAGALTESEKETVSALATLASGLAGGLVGDSTQSAAYAAQTGKTTVENNALNGGWGNLLPPQTMDYGQAQVSLVTNTNLTDENGKVLNPATEEQIRYASDKLVTGTLPDGANITKVIVEGYTDGVLIAGAWYLGPAATVGKVIGGATLAEIANGSYQWFDINSEANQSLPEGQRKTWDYWGSTSAAITGALAPGRSVTQNVGIAAGGALFTDGPNAKAIGSAAAGAWAGGLFGEYAPGFVNSITGKEIPGLVYDFWGGVGSEYVSGFIKDYGNPQSEAKDKNK
ncbi:hemagglutinin repeat-containing protein [Siccibacter turicensis]|uniref:hemagglutinin repeat-containing protein n=1 Tax=Siccibacter turicensis TaxID=357233 RepID=UPI0023F47CCC|nr:hemagglutinin repeat-containing protein [Siccibacter turicensis]